MTNFEKVMSVATPNWLAYLLSQNRNCDRCPAKCGEEYENQRICVEKIRQWLESKTKEEINEH